MTEKAFRTCAWAWKSRTEASRTPVTLIPFPSGTITAGPAEPVEAESSQVNIGRNSLNFIMQVINSLVLDRHKYKGLRRRPLGQNPASVEEEYERIMSGKPKLDTIESD
jgi:hypothetical protein